MKNDFLAGVIALAQENPARFVNLIRNGWPEIKAAIDQGHTLKVIHERLVKGGVRISYRLFTLYVRQLLGRSGQPHKPSGKVERNMTAPGEVENSTDSVPATPPQTAPDEAQEVVISKPAQESGAPTNDPWGNLRERLNENRSGFQWDEDVPDTSKLY